MAETSMAFLREAHRRGRRNCRRQCRAPHDDRTRCGSADVGRRRACTLRPCFRLVALCHDLATLKFAVQATTSFSPPWSHPRCRTRLKRVFDQQRADRLTALGHLHGKPISGKRLDAFPSGHAVHIGALASAATVLPPAQRNIAWVIGCGLVLTRIVLLAHWTSDVVAGLAVGAATERLLRLLTGFGRR